MGNDGIPQQGAQASSVCWWGRRLFSGKCSASDCYESNSPILKKLWRPRCESQNKVSSPTWSDASGNLLLLSNACFSVFLCAPLSCCDLLHIYVSSFTSPARWLWPHVIPFAHGQPVPVRTFSWVLLTWYPLFLLSDIETASDIALYSGLGAAVIAVAVLMVAVTLYRRSQSEYGVDVIDSSALTGGFQTFNFKTVRQG